MQRQSKTENNDGQKSGKLLLDYLRALSPPEKAFRGMD